MLECFEFLLAECFPTNLCGAEHSAGCVCRVNERGFIGGQCAHFATLCISEFRDSFEDICARTKSDIELSLFCLQSSRGKDGLKSRSENRLPTLFDRIDRVVDLLLDALTARVSRGEALHTCENRLAHSCLGGVVAE